MEFAHIGGLQEVPLQKALCETPVQKGLCTYRELHKVTIQKGLVQSPYVLMKARRSFMKLLWRGFVQPLCKSPCMLHEAHTERWLCSAPIQKGLCKASVQRGVYKFLFRGDLANPLVAWYTHTHKLILFPTDIGGA